MLLLHGTGAATHSWRGLAPLLATHFTLIAPDLPGHGFTQTPSDPGLSLPGMARLVAALLAELASRPKSRSAIRPARPSRSAWHSMAHCPR